jgi:glucosamine--fructose-6-phosphate aminotransferase (isomerizing)
MGAGAERAVAATKTFVLSVTAVLHLLAAWDRDAALRSVLATFPVTLARCDAVDWSAAAQVLAGREHAFVVGRGPTLPIAREIALKLAEVPGIHAQAESAAELLHGPISIASPAMAALVLAGDPRSQQSIREAITRLRAAGAAVLLLSPELEAGDDSREVIVIPRAQHDLLQPIVSLCAMYPFLARLARERGRDPDRPPNLQKLTRTI